jgi:hypothetical protein
VEYSWVKGHAYRGNEEPNRDERLDTEVDELCDTIRTEAMCSMTARGNCALWESEASALFIRGMKVTGKMKEQLQKQVHDSTLRKFLIEKEIWTGQQLDGLDWKTYDAAFKRMGKSRQTAIAKACHGL